MFFSQSIGGERPIVEFVGGPYDGFRHEPSRGVEELVIDVAVPVNVNTVLAATGQRHGPLLPFHRLAYYRLLQQPSGLQYLFAGEFSAEEVEPEG